MGGEHAVIEPGLQFEGHAPQDYRQAQDLFTDLPPQRQWPPPKAQSSHGPYTVAAYDHQVGSLFNRVTVAFHEGRVVGTMNVREKAHDSDPAGAIGDVYVNEEHRRKGVATAMLRTARTVYPVVHSHSLVGEGVPWAKATGN